MNFDGCELGWFDIFDSFSLVNQSDYLDHYNKDSYWLIVACFMTARSMLTTLLFALAINFVLKVICGKFEGFFLPTSFVPWPLPA